MTNTSKLRAGISGFISGVCAFIAWLVMVPPEQQTALLSPLVELTPIQYRDYVGLIMRGLATFSSIYAVYSAAQSGPATPPKNPLPE